MNSRRVWMLLFVVGFLIIFSAIASAQFIPSTPPGPFSSSANIGDLFGSVLKFFAGIFTLRWLGTQEMFTGFGRFLIWLLVFTALYAASSKLPGGAGAGAMWTPARRLIIVGVISFLSVIAIPQDFIIVIASLYGGVIMLLLSMALLGAIIWLNIWLYQAPFGAGWGAWKWILLILSDIVALIIIGWLTNWAGGHFSQFIYGSAPGPVPPQPGLPVR